MEKEDIVKELQVLLKDISKEQNEIVKQIQSLNLCLLSLLESLFERDPELHRLYQAKFQTKLAILSSMAEGKIETSDVFLSQLSSLGRKKTQ